MKSIKIILDTILSSELFEYILIDRHYRIRDLSEGVTVYLDPSVKIGDDIRDYLPEMVGYEHNIEEVFANKESRFILETVNKNDRYVNIRLNHFSHDVLLILLHNITEITLSKLQLLQYSNENVLLYNTIKKILDSQNNLLIVTTGQEVEYANKRFLEYFSFKSVDELNEREVCTFFKTTRPINSYDDLYAYAKDEEKQIFIRDDVFLIKAALLEKTYKLFTLSNITQLNNIHKDLEHKINIDPLTHLYKKPYFDKRVKKALQIKHPFSLVVIDLDNFKQINDQHGHLVGDKILVEFVELIRKNLRKDDLFARWGGEEFLLMIDSHNRQGIIRRLEHLKQAIEEHRFASVGDLTASFGLTLSKEDDTVESVLNRADEALYEAKSLGKNTVVSK